MTESSRDDGIPPAPPDAPTPPSGEPNTARSDAKQRHHRISEAAYRRARKSVHQPEQDHENSGGSENEL